MLTAKFANGKTIELIGSEELHFDYSGYHRAVYELRAKPDAIGLDELNALLDDESNTQKIELVSPANPTANVVSTPENYVLKIKAGIESRLVARETADAPITYEDQLIIQLGQLTYTERLMRAQTLQIEAALAQAAYTAMMSNTLLEG